MSESESMRAASPSPGTLPPPPLVPRVFPPEAAQFARAWAVLMKKRRAVGTEQKGEAKGEP